MRLADMHITPVPLRRIVNPRRVAARAGEDLVDRRHRAPHSADLGAATGARSANDTSLPASTMS